MIDGKAKDRRYDYIGRTPLEIFGSKKSFTSASNNQEYSIFLTGRTQYDAPEIDGVVNISSPVTVSQRAKGLNQGDFVEVKITDAQPYALISNP